MAKPLIIAIHYVLDGQPFIAVPATETELKELKLQRHCNGGDEQCNSGKRWRCLAGGDGPCVWYSTDESC